MHQGQLEVLLKLLLGLPVSEVSYQEYSNSTWSLAVMGSLDISMFDAVQHQLTKKHSLHLEVHGTRGNSAQPKVEEATQLHQASEWLTRFRPDGGLVLPRGCKEWHQRPHSGLGLSSQGNLSYTMLLQSRAYRTKHRLLVGCTGQTLYCPHMTSALPKSS